MLRVLERKAQLVSYFDSLEVTCASDLFEFTSTQARKFGVFKKSTSVVAVGNGPILSKHAKSIQKDFDVVVRFNDFTKCTGKVGSKLDLHVINMCARCNFARLHQPGVPTLVIEQNHCERNDCDDVRNNPIAFTLKKKHLDLVLSLGEFTTGFLALVLLKCLYSNPLTLIGFGGKGHEGHASKRISHGVRSEHVFIQQWSNDGGVKLADRKTIVKPQSMKMLGDVQALKDTVDKGKPWLANQRKRAKGTVKKSPAKVTAKGRGSHPICKSKYKTCSKYSGGKAWAKPATSRALPFMLAAVDQKTSLCYHCQSRLVREGGRI